MLIISHAERCWVSHLGQVGVSWCLLDGIQRQSVGQHLHEARGTAGADDAVGFEPQLVGQTVVREYLLAQLHDLDTTHLEHEKEGKMEGQEC